MKDHYGVKFAVFDRQDRMFPRFGEKRIREVLIFLTGDGVRRLQKGKVVNSGTESGWSVARGPVLIAGRSGIRWIEAWR